MLIERYTVAAYQCIRTSQLSTKAVDITIRGSLGHNIIGDHHLLSRIYTHNVQGTDSAIAEPDTEHATVRSTAQGSGGYMNFAEPKCLHEHMHTRELNKEANQELKGRGKTLPCACAASY